MDVVFKGFGGPATKFLDGGDVGAMEVKSHGPTGAQRVTADLFGLVACLPQANGTSRGSDGSVDVLGGHWLRLCVEHWFVDIVDG